MQKNPKQPQTELSVAAVGPGLRQEKAHHGNREAKSGSHSCVTSHTDENKRG